MRPIPFIVALSMLLGYMIGTMLNHPQVPDMTPIIEPIEVYRGNTTLEITYRDGVPVDSVVVMKKIMKK